MESRPKNVMTQKETNVMAFGDTHTQTHTHTHRHTHTHTHTSSPPSRTTGVRFLQPFSSRLFPSRHVISVCANHYLFVFPILPGGVLFDSLRDRV